ncbi:MAG: RluA family pseudouridine synthase [Bacteroidales bacterium]|nr:RluA family pseudouridine synthase [Bacteroidales bacterium]
MSQNSTETPPGIDGRILYEDNHLIIVNKLAGELAQGDDSEDVPLLEKVRDYIRVQKQKEGKVFCGLIHRLDRPVSGAIVFARTSKGLDRMNNLLKAHEMHKFYWAIVEGTPKIAQQKLTNYMFKNREKNRSYVSDVEQEGWKYAELDYRVMASSERYSLLEVELHTGRHHQIRAQLSNIGHPIKGDIKYGAKRPELDASICLHARRLHFEHPVSHEQVFVEAEPWNPLFKRILEESGQV